MKTLLSMFIKHITLLYTGPHRQKHKFTSVSKSIA